MGVVKFCVGAFLLIALCGETTGLYENNPFLSKVVPPVPNVVHTAPTLGTPDKLKQNIQQIAVVLPPGLHPQHPQVGAPPFNNQPGTILINIPSYYPQIPVNPQHPPVGVAQPPLPPAQPPIGAIYPQPPVGPVNLPKPPVSPTQPPQPEPADSLRKRCLRPRGQFPSAKCNKFVNCWDDLAVEQFCPVGLAFNIAGFCDYAYNVDCRGKPFEEIPAPQAPLPAPAPAGQPDIIAPPERYTTKKPDVLPPSYLPPGSATDEKLRKKCLEPRGLFPSDYCHRYVNCWDGNVVEQDCPPGLLYSYKGYCDYAYNVDCNKRILVSTTVPPPTASPAPPTNLPPDSIKPKPPQSEIIIPPTHPTYRPPLDAATGGTPVPPSYVPPATITDERLRRKCLGERGLFPSDYCNRFVNCWDKFAVEQECPPGLLFSEKGYCDYAYNVNCYNRTVITIPVSQPPASSAPPTNLPPDTLKPKPPQTEVVAPPTYRPPLDGSLTLPTPTKKPADTATPAPTYAPSGVVPDGNLKRKCLQLRGQFPSDVCNRYVNCWDGFVVEQDCPPGLLFSEKGYCDYAYNVNCNNRIIVTIPLALPTGPPGNGLPIGEVDKQQTLPPHHFFTQQPVPVATTPLPPYRPDPAQTQQPFVEPGILPESGLRRKCLGLRGQFPSDSCHRYIDCWDDYAVEHDCPPGLLFSAKGYCDFAYNVNCHNRTVIKSAPSPLCPAPHGTFRDRSNCSRYFTCIENAVAVKYECPSGLHFNDVIGVCDYAYRVDCTREPFVYQPLKDVNLLQKLPASFLDANIQCQPGRVFRLNPECTSAALCRNSMTEVIHCPAGLAYDAPSDRCTPPQVARCQDV